jgi:ferritin-like metal-binding protein YciE
MNDTPETHALRRRLCDKSFSDSYVAMLKHAYSMEEKLTEARKLARYYQEQLGHVNQEHECKRLTEFNAILTSELAYSSSVTHENSEPLDMSNSPRVRKP